MRPMESGDDPAATQVLEYQLNDFIFPMLVLTETKIWRDISENLNELCKLEQAEICSQAGFSRSAQPYVVRTLHYWICFSLTSVSSR